MIFIKLDLKIKMSLVLVICGCLFCMEQKGIIRESDVFEINCFNSFLKWCG